MSYSRLTGALVFFILGTPLLFAQTSGVSLINQRNVFLVVPTPNRQIPPSSNPLLSRNGNLRINSNVRRINSLHPPSQPKHRDPLQAGKPAPIAQRHPLTHKFITSASGSLATTAPPENSGVFPKGK